MATHSGPRRTWIALYIFFSVILVTLFVSSFRHVQEGTRIPRNALNSQSHLHQSQQDDKTILTGHAIAPKLGNETAKAELGRAAWKLFHTTFARFPDKPTKEESTALKSYVHLFQRLYPCGECASHFGVILEKYPPQVSSRSAAAAWGCHVHNEVNKSLKKELFDCSQIGDFYDCGCADDDTSGEELGKEEMKSRKDKGRHQEQQIKNKGTSSSLELEREE